MINHEKQREMKFSLWGWILFVVYAFFFIGSSIQARTLLSLVGSIIFLIACLVFIYPLLKRMGRDRDTRFPFWALRDSFAHLKILL